MPRRTIDLIRDRVRTGHYDMTAHAVEEMAEEHLDILDVEEAVLNGQITHTERSDLRGTKYTTEGRAIDQETPVGVVGRFTETGRYLIITVYAITA